VVERIQFRAATIALKANEADQEAKARIAAPRLSAR
jgi:hypothetical protein